MLTRRRHVFTSERRHIFNNNLHFDGPSSHAPIGVVENPLNGNATDAPSKYQKNKRTEFPVSATVRSWVNVGGGASSTLIHQSSSPLPARLLQRAAGNNDWVGCETSAASFTSSSSSSEAAACRANNNYRTLPLLRPRDWPPISCSAGSDVPMSRMRQTIPTKTTMPVEFGHCCSFAATSGNHRHNSRSIGATNLDKPEILTTFRSTGNGNGNTHVPLGVSQRLKLLHSDRCEPWASSFENSSNENEGAEKDPPLKSMRLLFDHRCGPLPAVELPNGCPTSSSPSTIISVPDLAPRVPTTSANGSYQAAFCQSPASLATNPSGLLLSSSGNFPVTSFLTTPRNENLARLRRATDEMTSSTDYLVPPSSVAPVTSSVYGMREDNDSSSLSS